ERGRLHPQRRRAAQGSGQPLVRGRRVPVRHPVAALPASACRGRTARTVASRDVAMRLRDAPARGTQSRMSYHVRLAQPDDRGSLLALQAELFQSGGAGKGRAELEQRFDWLYQDNPHGKAVTWVAVDDASGQVVGTTSFFPRLLALDGGTVRGALGGDGYVLPRFRRLGIGTAMHRASRRDTRVARWVRPLTPRALGVRSAVVNALVAPWMALPTRARLDPVTPGDARIEAVWREARARIGLGT